MVLLLLLEQGLESLEALNIYQGAGRIGDGIDVGLLCLNGVLGLEGTAVPAELALASEACHGQLIGSQELGLTLVEAAAPIGIKDGEIVDVEFPVKVGIHVAAVAAGIIRSFGSSKLLRSLIQFTSCILR